jgi:hypothetical protein
MTPKNVTSTQEEKNRVKDTEIAHLAGVFDEAGNINVNIAKVDRYTVGYDFRPLCIVSHEQSHEDDPMMGKIAQYCDEKAIKANFLDVPKQNNNRIEIKQPDSIERFLDPLIPYLVSEYRNSQIMLKQILPAVREQKHREKQGFYELMGYVDMIRKSRSQTKYTQEYFAEEWEDDLTVVE